MRVVWAALQDLDPGQLMQIYRRLQARIVCPEAEGTPDDQRLGRAVTALNEAADLLEAAGQERLVSVEAYRRLRADRRQAGWPPDGSIRRWLGGSWNDALRRAALSPAPDGDALVRELGGPFTRQECLEALQAYVAETGDRLPALWRYVRWAKRPDVRRRPGRRPQSQRAFGRLFQGWFDVLVQAGLARSAAKTGQPRGQQAEPPRPGSRGRIYSRSGYGYTPAQVRAALQEVARRLGKRSFKQDDFVRERSAIFAEEDGAGGPLRAFPSLSSIHNRYPTWDEALVDAGLEAFDGAHNKEYARIKRSSKRIADEEIFEALSQAYREAAVNGRLRLKDYQAWRRAELAKDQAAGRYRQLPEQQCLWQRFGSFKHALSLALATEVEK